MTALNKGSENLINSAIHIAYYMRGGIQYDDVLDRTYYERAQMIEYINKRIEYEIEKFKDSKGKIQPTY